MTQPSLQLSQALDFYYWCTPNGDKILILLEELALNYQLKPINILKGDQFAPAFLSISPNNKIPAIAQGDFSLFESGAILQHLAELSGQFINPENRLVVLQWLFWQVGGLGPMAGQNHHFNMYAPTKIDYAISRYEKETARLYGVLNTQLEGKDYIAGSYSIADMAAYPWIESHAKQNIALEDYPNVQAWVQRLRARPAIQRAAAINKQLSEFNTFTEDARQFMFK